MPFAKLHRQSATHQRIVQDFRQSVGRGLLQSNRHPDSPFSAVAGAAIGNERVVPELSGTKMVAAIERSTGQNRTTDTVAQRKVDKAAGDSRSRTSASPAAFASLMNRQENGM